MRPGGLLYITTPDITHWRRPRDLTRWDGFNPPPRCVYFSPASLAELLARHGPRVVKKRPAFKRGITIPRPPRFGPGDAIQQPPVK